MRFLLAAAGAAVITGFHIRKEGSPTVAAVTVSVDLRCTPTGVTYNIDPWSVTLKQGDTIEWDLKAEAHTDEMVIEPKQANAWPFATRNFRGGRTNRPHGRDMLPGQQGRRYQYNVLIVCKGPVTRPDTIRIDPEMIIQ